MHFHKNYVNVSQLPADNVGVAPMVLGKLRTEGVFKVKVVGMKVHYD